MSFQIHVLLACVFLQADDKLAEFKAKAINEMPAAQQKLKGILSEMELELLQQTSNIKSNSSSFRMIEITKHNEFEKFNLFNLTKIEGGTVQSSSFQKNQQTTVCSSPANGFIIFKQSPESKPVLTHYGSRNKPKSLFEKVTKDFLTCGYSILDLNIVDIISSDSFIINNISYFDSKKFINKNVIIDFSIEKKDEAHSKNEPLGLESTGVTAGSIVLRVNDGWKIQRFRVVGTSRKDNGFSVEGEVEYGDLDGHSLPTRFMTKSQFFPASTPENVTFARQSDSKVTHFSSQPPPAFGFTTQFYGIDPPRPYANRLNYILIIITIACIMFSVMFWKVSYRFQSPLPEASPG